MANDEPTVATAWPTVGPTGKTRKPTLAGMWPACGRHVAGMWPACGRGVLLVACWWPVGGLLVACWGCVGPCWPHVGSVLGMRGAAYAQGGCVKLEEYSISGSERFKCPFRFEVEQVYIHFRILGDEHRADQCVKLWFRAGTTSIGGIKLESKPPTSSFSCFLEQPNRWIANMAA